MKLTHIDNIFPGMMVGQDIANPQETGAPLVRRHAILTSTLIDLMRSHQIFFAQILDEMEKEAVLGKRKSEGMDRGIYIPEIKSPINKKLRQDALQNLEDLFSTVSMDAVDSSKSAIQVVRHLDRVAEQLVDSLLSDSNALVNIIDLKSYDEYTYHHSLSVAVLSLAVAQNMGMGLVELRRLAKCALMHDIGKTSVPIEIINKPSRLDPKEFAQVKEHSPAGYDYLTKSHIGDEDIWQGVLHHHEKLDGTGYPNGLRGNEIPLWSRIISVADVYDALTSNRPYRTPMQPSEAAEYIMGGVGSSFDYDVVKAFLAKLELYPVGSRIRLSNGRLAVVYNNENPMRPVVRLLPTGEIVDLLRDRQSLNLVISELLA